MSLNDQSITHKSGSNLLPKTFFSRTSMLFFSPPPAEVGVSQLVVAGLMMAVEYGQKTCGSKFDWLDVLTGCLVPLVLTAVFCVLYFII